MGFDFLQLVRRFEPGTAGERYLCAMFPTLLRIQEEKSPAAGGNRTHDLSCALPLCFNRCPSLYLCCFLISDFGDQDGEGRAVGDHRPLGDREQEAPERAGEADVHSLESHITDQAL